MNNRNVPYAHTCRAKEKKPKEIVSEEGLKIFVPGCRNCKGNNDDLTNDIPEVGEVTIWSQPPKVG